MSRYTTGEIAKLCGVSVRTVQYYDARGILSPRELTEGGRRLYDEQDVRMLRVICFLREIGFSIQSISELLREPEPGKVIELLLQQQREELSREIRERQEQLSSIDGLLRGIPTLKNFTVESIPDIANIMKNRKKLHRFYAAMIALGLVMDLIELGTLALWIFRGVWLPFALGMPLVVLMSVFISCYYLRRVAYICPHCHAVFQPRFAQSFFALHTPRTRRLVCPDCGRRSFCVEIYAEKKGK